MGINEDTGNRNRLAKITHFYSSNSNETMTTLDDYVDRMDPKQPAIYYIGGDSLQTVQKSPFVERLMRRNYEILYLLDPVDEYAVGHLTEHKGKRFQNIAKGDIEISESDQVAERRAQLEVEYKEFGDRIKSILNVLISKVKLSHRLVNTSCVVVADTDGLTGNMERIMTAQTAHRAQDPTAR
ncbi:endoplasmin-like [Octopus sinensis]|uniref:Endoplasmin-like n=1 Tax=Octopus sinensis TaxID=2607531 RepID=A0A6P7U815_9MOLL|nr:endoplasmin-like [Octopus sinensis]